MSQHHILVIDDDERLRDLLRRFLEESGFRVTDAGNASEARQILSGIMFDLLIIDIMMPGETGLEFLEELRKKDNVPALFLTAMSETEHRIEGLETGADDYMSKPFEPRELVLRIKRILQRKASVNHEPDALVIFGPFAFDLTTSTLTRDDVRIHITTAEQQLLANFANAPDTVLSRDDLSNAVEGRMEGRSIDVAVARLRRKLEPDPRHPVYLQTMRNRGWLLRTDRPPR
ncbi:response regulator transcription factor [Candidatus Puniceispirillum sp.]|jgi:two-component system, OmpR family, phosphate regulon response regulator OmpR|uniref:response regulator transcription factor n=1 Tax=Candidatus Puniceispirillum sp. TaxID=2026719 RepID=UPI001ED52026|nr:response regulator transcription factor [Candidatus Puniceispirillum sp.]